MDPEEAFKKVVESLRLNTNKDDASKDYYPYDRAIRETEEQLRGVKDPCIATNVVKVLITMLETYQAGYPKDMAPEGYNLGLSVPHQARIHRRIDAFEKLVRITYAPACPEHKESQRLTAELESKRLDLQRLEIEHKNALEEIDRKHQHEIEQKEKDHAKELKDQRQRMREFYEKYVCKCELVVGSTQPRSNFFSRIYSSMFSGGHPTDDHGSQLPETTPVSDGPKV